MQFTIFSAPSSRRAAAFAASITAAAVLLVGCDKPADSPPAAGTAVEPAAVTAPPAPVTTAPANGPAFGGTATATAPTTPPPASSGGAVFGGSAPQAAPATAAVRTVASDVQGATAGLTVRVKSIELGADSTTLAVNASFANQRTNYTKLATTDTYLQDESGNKLMLKRPDDNRDLNITNGGTMDGKLVFLGSVAAGAKQLKLVFNDGRAADDLMGPGLTMVLPLQPAS